MRVVQGELHTVLAPKPFGLPRTLAILGRYHIRVAMRCHRLVQRRKPNVQIIRTLPPCQAAGQRDPQRILADPSVLPGAMRETGCGGRYTRPARGVPSGGMPGSKRCAFIWSSLPRASSSRKPASCPRQNLIGLLFDALAPPHPA